jgi:hypothetical protein
MIAIAVIMLVRVRLPKKIRTKIMTFSKIAAVKIGPRESREKAA